MMWPKYNYRTQSGAPSEPSFMDGFRGSLTPEAIQNAIMQSGKGGGGGKRSPFDSMLDHATQPQQQLSNWPMLDPNRQPGTGGAPPPGSPPGPLGPPGGGGALPPGDPFMEGQVESPGVPPPGGNPAVTRVDNGWLGRNIIPGPTGPATPPVAPTDVDLQTFMDLYRNGMGGKDAPVAPGGAPAPVPGGGGWAPPALPPGFGFGGGGGGGGSSSYSSGGGGGGPMASMPQMGDEYLKNLESSLDLYNERQRADALRDLRSAAAPGGMGNSGAFLGAQEDMIRDLSASQGREVGAAMFTSAENEQNRALSKYGIDTSAATARAASAAAASSSRYATDASRYGAELGYQGLLAQLSQREQESIRGDLTDRYGIDVDYQGLQDQLGTQRYGMDLGFLEGMEGLAVQDRGNVYDYNLGVLGTNRDIYGIDTQHQQYLMDLMARLGPEQFYAQIFGTQQPPPPVVYMKG